MINIVGGTSAIYFRYNTEDVSKMQVFTFSLPSLVTQFSNETLPPDR